MYRKALRHYLTSKVSVDLSLAKGLLVNSRHFFSMGDVHDGHSFMEMNTKNFYNIQEISIAYEYGFLSTIYPYNVLYTVWY